jgi:hypothetical protein
MLRPVSAGAGPDLPVQVGHRGRHACLVGLHGGPAGGLVAEGIQEGDVLDRPQHQVPSRHCIAARRPAERLARVGVAPGEQPPELLLGADPLLAECRAAGAEELPGALAVAGQVFFVVAGHLPHVVVAAPSRQLVQVRGHRRSRPSQQAAISPSGRHGCRISSSARAGSPVTSHEPSVAGAAQRRPSSAPTSSVTARRTSRW